MFEYQVIVSFQGSVLFRTCWHAGATQARDLAWLLASKLNGGYEVGVATRKEEFVATPWEQFGLELPL
jgi:hypothetical protein